MIDKSGDINLAEANSIMSDRLSLDKMTFGDALFEAEAKTTKNDPDDLRVSLKSIANSIKLLFDGQTNSESDAVLVRRDALKVIVEALRSIEVNEPQTESVESVLNAAIAYFMNTTAEEKDLQKLISAIGDLVEAVLFEEYDLSTEAIAFERGNILVRSIGDVTALIKRLELVGKPQAEAIEKILSTVINYLEPNALGDTRIKFTSEATTPLGNTIPLPRVRASDLPFADGTQITPDLLGFSPVVVESLASIRPINERIYLMENPDVSIAVRTGEFTSALQHFKEFGADEGRTLILFNEKTYLAQNLDVAKALAAGDFASGLQHFIKYGFAEGRGILGPDQALVRSSQLSGGRGGNSADTIT